MITLAALAGCASHRDTDTVNTHCMREIHLTRAEPTDKKLGVTLVRVDSDGAAVIAVKQTSETLRALPGEPYVGRRSGEYNVSRFGEGGLVLLSSDIEAQSAVLESRWAE